LGAHNGVVPETEVFADDRGRVLRASRHPDDDCVVLSIWGGDECLQTFRLPAADAARLASLLFAGWAESLRASAAVVRD
jgi:hypothetical protein